MVSYTVVRSDDVWQGVGMGQEIASAAVIGFGATGSPLADRLWALLGDRFRLVATGARRMDMEREMVTVNGRGFRPGFIPSDEGWGAPELLVVCVKNYSLESALPDIRQVVGPETVLLPLQNGIYACDYFRREFPHNMVLRGFVQGPNTRRRGNAIRYTNPGTVHFGTSRDDKWETVKRVRDSFAHAGIPSVVEDDIERSVWKKWMLNVAGNTVTALTSADYSDFRWDRELVRLCRASMGEFLQVAHAENVALDEGDVDEIIEYYTSYEGSKRTSMLEDVLARRRTENEYLAGELIRRAETYGIDVPVTRTLYGLMHVKEELYRNGSHS